MLSRSSPTWEGQTPIERLVPRLPLFLGGLEGGSVSSRPGELGREPAEDESLRILFQPLMSMCFDEDPLIRSTEDWDSAVFFVVE